MSSHIIMGITTQESLSSTFSDLLASDTFVDVTLSCEGAEVVRAHRLLLAACSPYFRRLLAGLASHHHPVILLRDVRHNHLVGILEFIYNGEVWHCRMVVLSPSLR